MSIALKLLLWLVAIEANVYADRKGRKPGKTDWASYLVMFILRCIAAILHAALFIPGQWMGTDFANRVWLHLWLPVVIFQATSFWLLFDVQLNLINHFRDEKFGESRKLTWKIIFYYDRKEGDSGKLERWFRDIGPTWGPRLYILAKLLALAACIYSVVLIYARYSLL